MNTLITLGVIVAAGVALFGLGAAYGTSAERYVVAKALAEYGRLSAGANGLVQSLLLRLKTDYTYAYDEVVADFERIKKAL